MDGKARSKTFTVGIDEKTDECMDRLKAAFHRTSKADVFRMGIALLNVAHEANEKGHRLTISDSSDTVIKEIVIS